MGVQSLGIRCEFKFLNFERFFAKADFSWGMPDDERSDLFPEPVAAVPPTLMAPTEPVISIQAAASDRHSASKPARSAPLSPSGQLILGADQHNPLLTVYHDEEHQQLLVY